MLAANVQNLACTAEDHKDGTMQYSRMQEQSLTRGSRPMLQATEGPHCMLEPRMR